MRRKLIGGLTTLILGAAATPAHAADRVVNSFSNTRAEYVAQVEPICQDSAATMKRMQRGVVKDFREGRKAKAARKTMRAAGRFDRGVDAIGAVPQPTTDAAVLAQWVDSLRVQVGLMRAVARAVKASPPGRVTFTPRHNRAARRFQRHAPETNALVEGFGFDHCLL